jgi:hypothetical protein
LFMDPTTTFGEVFPGGAMIEAVKCTSDGRTLSLLAWDGAEAKIGAEVQLNGRMYRAAPIKSDLLQAMTLPSNVLFRGSARMLLAEVCAIVQQFSGLDPELTMLVGRFILASWLVGSRAVTPGLCIFGEETIACSQLWRLLRCLCRRALALTEVDAPGILSLPTGWHPTFLIHQAQLSSRTEQLLRAARTRDVQIPHRGRLLNIHGAVATRTEFPQSREPGTFAGIEIPISPRVSNLSALNSYLEREIALFFSPSF